MAAERISLYRRVRAILKRILPSGLYLPYRYFRYWDNRATIHSFLRDTEMTASFFQRFLQVYRSYVISNDVHCPHSQEEVLSFCSAILKVPPLPRGA